MGKFEFFWELTSLVAVLGAIGLFVGYLINRKRARRNALDKTSTSEQFPNRFDHLNNDLLLKVLGDQAKAKRLIEFERQKTPTNSEAELVQAAIDRWERDNR